ncbi:MAG: hypothetical protein DWQ01_17080 [Planctomycetota bacterium]|nr:MAG: hypothetical protein DWQ01_17080 [Planctomycetota bacterium]
MNRFLSIMVALCWMAVAIGCQVFEPTVPELQRNPADQLPPAPANLMEQCPELDLGQPFEAMGVPDPLPEVEIPSIGDQRRYSFEFRDISLSQALHFIAQQAEINIYLDSGLDQPVDASLPSVTFDEALAVLLKRNGMKLVEDPPGVYWVDQADGNQEASVSFQVQSINAADIEANLKALVGEEAVVIVDGSQNRIMVRGRQKDLDLIRDYLKSVDRLQRQVLIEVRILEVSLDERFELGISAGLHDRPLGDHSYDILQAFTTPASNFTLQFNSEQGGADATIQALSKYLTVNVVSSPRVMAITNTEASIQVIQEIPYTKVTASTSTSDSGAGSQVLEEVEFKEAGVTLKVTPTIQESGVLQIKIDQVISDVVDFFNSVPVIDSRDLKAQFLVHDRDTIVLGGLMQNRNTKTDTGIPVLMEIPLIGRLFRSDEDVLEKRELLVFVTPYIVEPKDADRFSGEIHQYYRQRLRMDGAPVLDEEKRNKAAGSGKNGVAPKPGGQGDGANSG